MRITFPDLGSPGDELKVSQYSYEPETIYIRGQESGAKSLVMLNQRQARKLGEWLIAHSENGKSEVEWTEENED